MRLDRNTHPDGRQKYAVIKLRNMPAPNTIAYDRVCEALGILTGAGMLEYGPAKSEAEIFVIMLRDRYARPAMLGYSRAAQVDSQVEYADDILELADRSGTASPFCKTPD